MWGGVKKRTHYGDLFKKWSASRGLVDLRVALYKEPRPWYLAYSLHQCNHLLQDHHCARLLAWCTSIMELRPGLSAKQEAYRYTQEMFQLFMRHHKVGRETLNEYLRLCAVGADLTSAFDWFKYWQEAQLGDCAALHTLTWLLQVARATPSDERAEDVALTVMDLYTSRFSTPAGLSHKEDAKSRGAATTTSASPLFSHYEPTSSEDVEALHRFFSVFKSLQPRLQHNEVLHRFLDTLPLSVAAAETNCDRFGWPVESAHRAFPQLEQHKQMYNYAPYDPILYASPSPPRLRDSLLNTNFIAKLESSSEKHNVAAVVALVEEFERRLQDEKDKVSNQQALASRQRLGEVELWCSPSDPSTAVYRRRLVDQGGVTPELYHYLITALTATQPTAALRTLEGMEAANLRPLDLTRAEVLVAVRDSAEDQRRLFLRQLEEIEERTRLDADHDTHKVVEAYWKYDYTEFFHYRNALSRADFYLFLMARLGTQPLQQMLLDTQMHGSLATTEDLVVLDDDLRHAARLFFRSRVGRGPVQAALNEISHHMPKLDISLVGTLPHFENYFVESADDIAHSETAIQALVRPHQAVYVLDASFIETSESFLRVGSTLQSTNKEAKNSDGTSQSLVLIPYLSLAQLASSVASSDTFTSFDPALQQAIRAEPFLASQRLRALFAMLNASSTASAIRATRHAGSADHRPTRRIRVLHFTECLCANQIEQEVLDGFKLSPATNDNDQLLLVLAMLSCLKPPATRLVLCTDDPQLVKQLESLQSSDLFSSAVEVVSTAPPANFDLEKDLIDDNPTWRDDRWRAAPEFEPRLDITVARPPQDLSNANVGAVGVSQNEQGDPQTLSSASSSSPSSPTSEGRVEPAKDACSTVADEVINSPWLALLEEQEEETKKGNDGIPTSSCDASNASDASYKANASTELSITSSKETQEHRDRLMNLYETPLDVIPVGMRMEEASTLGSVFTEFDSMDPEQREARAAAREAARSRLAPGEKDGAAASPSNYRRRRSVLEKEMLANRGFSNKDRFLMARRLSNQSGGRVPFNMRYRVVEANVRDPRNAHLRKVYEEGLEKKRAVFKRRHG